MQGGVEIQSAGVILYPPVWAVVVLTLGVGAFVGLVNGVLVAYFRVPAFVATLGSLYVARGVALLMTNGLTFNNLSGDPSFGNTGFGWLGLTALLVSPSGGSSCSPLSRFSQASCSRAPPLAAGSIPRAAMPARQSFPACL